MKTSAFDLKKLIVPGVVMLAFWAIAIWGWIASGSLQPLIIFGYIGLSFGFGLGGKDLLRRRLPVGARTSPAPSA